MFPSKSLASWIPLKSFVLSLASPWLPFVRRQLEAKAFLTEILTFSRTNFLHLRMRFFYFSNISFEEKLMFPSKPLASWPPLKSSVSPLASPWLPFVRRQLEAKAFLTEILTFSRTNFLHLRMRFFYFSNISFEEKLMFPSKPLASWLPLKSFVSPWASSWLAFVRSQLQANSFLTEILKFLITNSLHLRMRSFYFSKIFCRRKINVSFKTLGLFSSIEILGFTFGFPLASFCQKPT